MNLIEGDDKKLAKALSMINKSSALGLKKGKRSQLRVGRHEEAFTGKPITNAPGVTGKGVGVAGIEAGAPVNTAQAATLACSRNRRRGDGRDVKPSPRSFNGRNRTKWD